MSSQKGFTRRGLLKSGAALGGLALTAGAPFSPARAAGDLTVGFIYVGPRDDYGYNQAHAEGAAAVKAMEGVTVVEEENVAETVDVQSTMESMINYDGATLLFPTSFGYFDPHILELAPKNEGVRFEHCGGLWSAAAIVSWATSSAAFGSWMSDRARFRTKLLCRSSSSRRIRGP